MGQAATPGWPDPAPGTGPEAVRATVPAELRFLSAVRAVVTAAVAGSGCDQECEDDLRLATDELAAVVIEAARPGSSLLIMVLHDEDDVYVRLTAPSAKRSGSMVPELSRLLLVATVDSFDVGLHGDELVAVLQRRARSEPR